jgi:hypothetical protein
MELYDSRRKEAEQSTLLDLIAKKNELVSTKDILKNHNFDLGSPGESNIDQVLGEGEEGASNSVENGEEEKQLEEENTYTTESSGLFYNIPTPGPSRSDFSIND